MERPAERRAGVEADEAAVGPRRRHGDDLEAVLDGESDVADAVPPTDSIAVVESPASLLAAPGRDHDVLAPPNGRGEILSVGDDEAEFACDPAHRRHVRHASVERAVGQVAEPVVERDGQHAHIVGQRPAVVARDQACLADIEVFEPFDREAVVVLPGPPEVEPEPARQPVEHQRPVRSRMAP